MDSWQMLQLKMRSSGWRGFGRSVSVAIIVSWWSQSNKFGGRERDGCTKVAALELDVPT
jgi:hypothetical protein